MKRTTPTPAPRGVSAAKLFEWSRRHTASSLTVTEHGYSAAEVLGFRPSRTDLKSLQHLLLGAFALAAESRQPEPLA